VVEMWKGWLEEKVEEQRFYWIKYYFGALLSNSTLSA
jgi:hypothetical protein